MTILVTGGAGFIGSHLCEHLLANGLRVICLDNFDDFYDPAIKERNVAPLLQNSNYLLVRGDIRDASLVHRVFEHNSVDCVIHLAAKAGVRPSILQPALYMDVNVNGTATLLEAMRRSGVKRFIFGSSSSIYGNQEKQPFSETDDVSCPISPYAASKRSGELLSYTYHHLYGMDVACLRFFTVYGPRQRPDLAIHKFTQLALAGQPVPLYGDGGTRRDYTFVADIVQGILKLMDNPNWHYEIFNLGCGNPVTLLEMVHAIENALDQPLKINFLDKQPGDVEQTHADIRKARAYFGYAPEVGLQDGVRQFVEWYGKGDKE
ncbi:MAG: NAD-dependent epimerase/dehydratase family protein [Haliscomenobacteraceae bacterium CHB4]|nr:UDP-glucose 4-epimerase [Saprospiraceae bacterium]MCE7923121.1 NAD-dependent epimerase/dehydratase family protein [Haliscomenobacteraceae bacterium CHB4]